MKHLIALSAALLLPSLPALAQTATPPGQAAAKGPVAGATVYDPAGAVVGTIESVTAEAAIVTTGTAKAGLPLASFGTSPKGPVIGFTKAQFEAAAQQQQQAAAAQFRSQLVAGTQVRGQDGATVVGTIKTADAAFVTLDANGREVRLPVTAFAPGTGGGVIIGMTAAEFQAAVAGAATPAPAPAQ